MSGIKACYSCHMEQPLENFHKDSSRRDGRAYVCKSCAARRRRKYYVNVQREVMRKKYDPVKARAKRLMSTYGLSLENYTEILDAQGGGCAICGKREMLHVDHCHATGKVRGILCSNCNTSIGGFMDDIALLEKAIQYLKASSS